MHPIQFFSLTSAQLDERLKREGTKTHKERVEELNRYLSNLSEHHDMYVLFLSKAPMCFSIIYYITGVECHEPSTNDVRRMADHEMQAQNWTWIRKRLSPARDGAGRNDEGT